MRGSTHSRFFAEALFSRGGAPANISVDGADAWNGVRLQVAALHGDADHVTPIEIDGEVNILENVLLNAFFYNISELLLFTV